MSDAILKLPAEIVQWQTNLGATEDFQVMRQRHQAITLVNQRIGRVYKFVLRSDELSARLDLEVATLIRIEQVGIAGPRVLNRERVGDYELVEFEYVPGEVRAGRLTVKDVQLMASAQLQLHTSFAGDSQPVSGLELVERVLSPLLNTVNSKWFSQEVLKYAEQLREAIKSTNHVSDLTLVHTDGHFWNVIFTGEDAVLIDWAEAGFGSRYYDLGVTVEALLLEPIEVRSQLVEAYLMSYFDGKVSASDIDKVQLYFELRCLEGMTWHLNESLETQETNRDETYAFIAECWQTLQTNIESLVQLEYEQG